MEKEWKLGVDLGRKDNLLDPITFDDVMLALRCNCSVIDEKTFDETLSEIFDQRMTDFKELVDRNRDLIINFVRREKEDWD